MDFSCTKMYILLMFLVLFDNYSNAHECYVCENQDSNNGKCVTTVQPCEFGQNFCLSEIKWASTPYWEIGAPMQHFVSKKCATEQDCDRTISEYMPYCQRIWWKDWKCAECCKGDRCNHYITLGSSSTRSSAAIITFGVVFGLLYNRFF